MLSRSPRKTGGIHCAENAGSNGARARMKEPRSQKWGPSFQWDGVEGGSWEGSRGAVGRLPFVKAVWRGHEIALRRVSKSL